VTIRGDLAEEDTCQHAVDRTVAELDGLDVLVNNVATTRAAVKHLPDGGAIIDPRPSTGCAAPRP
jgi:NAD(P)-dependent dehydrogenase (short-subunit alcohol dehydrogenase family)